MLPFPQNEDMYHDSVNLYEKLAPYKEFRTITLLAGSDEDFVKCTLKRHYISHPPGFEALSYGWGHSGQLSEFIILNGALVKVTDNLFSVLRHLR